MRKRTFAVLVGAGIVDIPVGPVGTLSFTRPSTPAKAVTLGFGGDALNEAITLARLGHGARLVSKVGDDPAGRLVIEHCASAGVDTRFVAQQQGLATGINIVLVDEVGERRFITSESGSLRALGAGDIPAEAVADASVACLASVFVSPHLRPEELAELFAGWRAQGVLACADFTRPKRGETLADIADALAQLDYAFPSREEAEALTGECDPVAMAAAFAAYGVRRVAIKLGGEGCYIHSGELCAYLPAVRDVSCVDTTGAGDSFVAGFLCGLLEGRTFPECARLANAAASLTVEGMGAGAGARDRVHLGERYKQYARQLGLQPDVR